MSLNSQSCENGGHQSHPKPHQCDIKATTRPVDRHRIGTPKPPQGSTKATPRLPQGYPKATPKLPQGSTKATFMRPSSHAGLVQFRNPKAEIRRKSETRSPKEAASDGHAAFGNGSG